MHVLQKKTIDSVTKLFHYLFYFLGEWNAVHHVVLYPFDKNDLKPRTFEDYSNAVKEVKKRSKRRKAISVSGIKGSSALMEV